MPAHEELINYAHLNSIGFKAPLAVYVREGRWYRIVLAETLRFHAV
jgi:hypothetical protein